MAKKTIMRKQAFAKFAHFHGIKIMAYHANNGIFKAKKWVTAVKTVGQTIMYANVGAHHQNNIAECHI